MKDFANMVTKYERLIYTVCVQIVRDAATAEDLTQETFLSAYLHLDTCPDGFEKQWLARIATNKAKDYLQSAYARHTTLPGDADMPPDSRVSPPPEELVVSQGGANAIADRIYRLKEPYHAVCVLYFLQERTAEEIAMKLGRPVKTVHTQIDRARKMLRSQLERSDGYGTV